MSKLELTAEEARDIVYGDTFEWLEIKTEVDDTSRWSVNYSAIYQNKETGKFYCFDYSEGATEMQDEHPYDHEESMGKMVVPVEVEPVETVVVKYLPVDRKKQ